MTLPWAIIGFSIKLPVKYSLYHPMTLKICSRFLYVHISIEIKCKHCSKTMVKLLKIIILCYCFISKV